MTFRTIPGTVIDEIRAEHPEWTEDQCRDEQKRVAFAAWGLSVVPGRTALVRGQKVKFSSERLRYTVRAANERFAICTKPFNARHTTLYTIIDFKRRVRGRENLIFGMGFETDEDCQRALARLIAGESEVSYRHYVALDIEEAPC